jgi:hypothetical protein
MHPMLAVWISLIGHSLVSPAGDDLESRFLSEAVPIYERAARLLETGINGRSESVDPATGFTTSDRILCRGDYRLVEFNRPGAGGVLETMVCGLNGQYGFVLRGHPEGAWAIQEVLTRADAATRGLLIRWPLPIEAFNHFAVAGISDRGNCWWTLKGTGGKFPGN